MDPAEPESIWEALFDGSSRNHASEITYEFHVVEPGRTRKVATIDATLEKRRNLSAGRRRHEESGALRVSTKFPWGHHDRQGSQSCSWPS